MATATQSAETPTALRHYWAMWNEPDVERVRHHLDQAVTPGVEWTDPMHAHVGRDALEENVRTLRTDKPEYRFVIGSLFDGHHNLCRYEWHMMRKHRVLLRGLDVVTFAADGLIGRVDGFFGELQPAS